AAGGPSAMCSRVTAGTGPVRALDTGRSVLSIQTLHRVKDILEERSTVFPTNVGNTLTIRGDAFRRFWSSRDTPLRKHEREGSSHQKTGRTTWPSRSS